MCLSLLLLLLTFQGRLCVPPAVGGVAVTQKLVISATKLSLFLLSLSVHPLVSPECLQAASPKLSRVQMKGWVWESREQGFSWNRSLWSIGALIKQNHIKYVGLFAFAAVTLDKLILQQGTNKCSFSSVEPIFVLI